MSGLTKLPVEGEVYQHQNGKNYTVLLLAKDQDREEIAVIHKGEDGQIWSRPIGNFMAYKDGLPRFTLKGLASIFSCGNSEPK